MSTCAEDFYEEKLERLDASSLTCIDDTGPDDIAEVLVEQEGTDLVLALSEEGEVGLYGAMSECLIYYLSDADAPLFERIAAKLRELALAREEPSRHPGALKPCFGACQIGCDPCTEPDCPNTEESKQR